ncbi:MAG: T9SS type A sorting domain-containing protein [Ignavibacteriaceae bacterium]
MRYFIHFFTLFSFLFLFSAENILAQEEPGIFTTSVQFKGNNSEDPNDVSGLPELRNISEDEIQLINEIRELREKNDRNLLDRVLELESQLEAINPNSVSKPAEYYDGTIAPAQNEKTSFIPESIGNTEIFNSGTSIISSIATATEQVGTTAGRIWVSFTIRSSGAADTLRLYYSDNHGANWTYYGWGKLGGTDQINIDQMDMEIIENTTGEKYIWIVYGYRNDAGTGRWRTGGVIFQTPTFGGQFFALSWPGDDATKRYYRLRITSDNATYPSLAYVYMVSSFDSLTGSGIHLNTQKTLRCTNPYTFTPTFSYKADKFWWFSSTDGNQRDLHSDIAFFDNGPDSIIVSFSNVPDSTKLFFAKSNASNGPGTADGAGGFIGGSQPDDHKQFARLSSNGNDNGSVFAVFRQNTNSIWRIKYFRTTNFGNFNSMSQAALQGSVTSHSYPPDIVGVRNMPKHYFAWIVNGTPDSLRYIGTTNLGIWPQNVGMMNGQSSLSPSQGAKPGFRFVNDDSCFAVYSLLGPYDVWAAFGCSGPVSVEDVSVVPDNYSISQNYPNPFNPSTTIKYSIPQASFVKIKVYNTLGQVIAELVNQEIQIGNHEVSFDARNLTSGIYFYRIEAGNFVETRKMILIK